MKIPELIEKHKYLFGTYSAMALMNIQTVLNHIQKITNIKGSMPKNKEGKERPEDFWEHPVMTYLNNKNVETKVLPETTELVMQKLMQSFPFLKIMAENQRENSNKITGQRRLGINSWDIYQVLNNCFWVLKKYRDYSCHFMIKDGSWNDDSNFLKMNETKLSIMINKYYDVVLRNLKERYNYTTGNLAFIQDFRYKESRSRDGRKTMVTNVDFFLSMQSFNDDKTKRLHLSGVGVALLISLFLEKKYITTFLDKLDIRGGYSKSSEQCRIIRRSILLHSVRLPRERIHSSLKAMSIAMDMLNELKRCPKELFDVISFADQDRFRIISSDYNEVLQMRHTDRFAQLALQYIDYNQLFKSIRFHVNMGKLRYLFAPNKVCIDGQERVRVLERPLNGYGRIEEMEQYRKSDADTYGNYNIPIRGFDNAMRDDANPDNYPYVVDAYTQYILNNNKIELRFTSSKVVPWIGEQSGKWCVENEIPDCRMSTLELPAMIFHMLLLGEEATERRINEVVENYKRLFKAMSADSLNIDNIDSFGIARADMPQKVIDAINGVTTSGTYCSVVKKVAEDLLVETRQLIDRYKKDKQTINSQNNKMGKRSFRQISSGRLASFLAKDIVKFQPSQAVGRDYGTDRLTGMNYRVMQAAIATYNSDNEPNAFNRFRSMFEKAGLIGRGDKSQYHPFLSRALSRRPRNAVEFYDYYLQARKSYLENIVSKMNNGEDYRLPFVNPHKNKWLKRDSNYYKVMGEIYSEDTPIELPRQMFDNEIKKALQAMPQMCGIDYDKANVTYLIGEYLKRVCGDDFQEFYYWKRNYQYMDMLKCEVGNLNKLEANYLSTQEREQLWSDRELAIAKYRKWAMRKRECDYNLRRLSLNEYEEVVAKRLKAGRIDYQKNEKLIRRYKVQDALMFMMVGREMTRNLQFNAYEFKLHSVMPDADRGILSMIMPMDFVFKNGGKTYTIHSDGIKLKNYGDFFALAHDKRIVPLLNILSTDVVNKEEIELEFDNYDNCRPNVVKLVLDFEKLAFDKYPNLRNDVDNGVRVDFSYILNDLIEKGDFDRCETHVLSQIRNSFNHNQYPKEIGIVEINTLPHVANHLIEIFGEYATKLR